MITFSEQNQIQITQIDSPHKFWYKNCNDLMENRRLKELENSIEKYVTDLRKWEEQQVPIKRGDEIAAFHAEWQKWIRGKAGRLKPGSKVDIFIWAIDYGCKLTMPLENVYLLQDQSLACKNPINVHIGGLSGISPVEFVSLNLYLFLTIKLTYLSKSVNYHFSRRKKTTHFICESHCTIYI